MDPKTEATRFIYMLKPFVHKNGPFVHGFSDPYKAGMMCGLVLNEYLLHDHAVR